MTKKLSILVILLLGSIQAFAETTQTNPDSIPFAPAVSYGAGDHPCSVFCADLDGDGDLDLAVANNYSYNVSILKNNGEGTFQTTVNYGAGNGPVSVFCADLDGDLDKDLAVADNWNGIVSILKNNGNGTFQTAVNYGAGGDLISIFCADLDGDLDLDLAVASDGGFVSILKNNGDGTFQGPVYYGAGSAPQSVFCADLDGDLDLDLAVANLRSDNVSILKNNGDGSFQTAVNYGVGHNPRSVFCADLDGDGDLDLAVANNDSYNVSILKNNGDGTFQTAVNYGAGVCPYSVFCADLDGDSDLDLAVANAGGNVSILKNNGDGTFQTAVNYGAGDHPWSVFCADLDGDGDLDLAVANLISDNVSILKNLSNQAVPGTITGTVKDASTQQNLPGVLVEAIQNSIIRGSCITNSSGHYFITNLSSGIYDIRASKSGYETQTQTGKYVFAGQTTTQNFNLNPIPYEPFYFVHISAPHVGAHGAAERFKLVIDSINALTPPPEFVVISGDLVSRGGHNPYWEKFDSLLDSLRPPVYVCVGNHDYRSFRWLPDNQYLHYFNDYAICPTSNLGLVSMNSGCNADDVEGWIYVSGIGLLPIIDWTPEGSGLSSSQMSWLTDIMDNHPGYNKILFMHHPVVCTQTSDQFPGEEESNGCITNNRNELMNLCRNEDVKVVLSGHTHKPYEYTVDNANHPVTLSENLAPNGYWSSYTAPDLPMYIITGACSENLEYRKIEVQGEEVKVYKEEKFNGSSDLAEYHTDIFSWWPLKKGQSWGKADSSLAPGRLHAYDSFGNHVGVNDIGGIDFQIANAYYEDEPILVDSSDTNLLWTNGETISLMSDPNQSYTYKIEAFLPCSLNVTGHFVKKNGEGEVSTSYLGIPFSSGSVGKLFITNESIDYTLYIDDDGDSTVDREILPDTIITSLRGDANGDGVINAADVVYLINYLFISGPAPVPLEAGDCNCDGNVNASDVVYLINYLFIDGPPPGC
jgi:predicted phosphodiesterase